MTAVRSNEAGVLGAGADPVTGTGELWGIARWTEAGLTADVKGPRSAVVVDHATGRRVLIIGELHTRKPEDAAELITRLTAGASEVDDIVAGGWAAVVVDPAAASVYLVTDPFGIQPMYYVSDGKHVAFATRLGRLRQAAPVAVEFDWTAVYHYLNFAYVPGPGTIFCGVSLLSPGSMARCWNGKVETSTYWDVTYPADAQGSEGELAATLRREIERAVHASWPLSASQRVGCFLSGGTDSGTIATLGAQIEPRLGAYSIAFRERSYNELAYARLVAGHSQLHHRIHHLTADDLLESIPVLTEACEQPHGNPSIVATWRCSRLAREAGIDVLLAGDGGDELFGGNERYAKDRVYRLYHRLPAGSRATVLNIANRLPERGLLLNRLRNFAYRGNQPNPDRLYSDDALASRRWDELVTASLRHRVSRDASLNLMRGYYEAAQAGDDLDRLLYVDLKTAIWGNDLVKVMSAARIAGIRVRFPFLDPRLAAYTGRLGAAMKVRRLEKRYLFKRAVADLLPHRVLHKPKHGFSVPVAEWIRTNRRVQEAVLDPIVDPGSVVGECLSRAGVDRLIEEHRHERWDHGSWLWALMMLSRWHRYVKSPRGTVPV